jgi:hypothetical protein
VPGWSGDFDLQLTSTGCIEVFEDGAQTTATVTCTGQIGANPLDLPGVRLAKPTLDGLLAALGKTQFPLDGLVVGLVLDYLGNPMANVTVTASTPAHIQYLTGDRSSFSATTTSSNGIWLSTDAPYGTTFQPAGMAASAFGGLVAGKVDIVIIQFPAPSTGP